MLAAATASWTARLMADTADRRHGMSGIADAQQPGPIPLAQAIDANRQQLDIIPIAELTDAVARKRDQGRDLVAQGGQPPLPHFIGGSLGYDIGALPIVPTVDHRQDPAGLDAAEALPRIAGPARQAGLLAHRRMAPIRPDGRSV